MLGLLLKEYYNLLRYGKTILGLAVFYLFFSIVMKNVSFITSMVMLLFAIMTVTSFSYDDMAKWDKYAASLPVTRKKIVGAKYLLGVVLTLIGGLLSLLGIGIVSLIQEVPDLDVNLMIIAGTFTASFFYLALLLPVLYKFGAEKSRFIMLAVFFIPFGLVYLLNQTGITMPSEETIVTFLKLAPFGVILMYIISYFISCAIYKKKEL